MSARYVYGVASLLLLTAGYACWCTAPLIWDGAYQFNASLVLQSPYHYLTRFHSWLIWWPTVWASRWTSNVMALQAIYGLPFLLAPLAGLLLSWWMAKDHAPGLMVWVVFGVAAATLPGQIFIINDSIFQQHLFWPLFVGMFVPLSWPKRIVLAILAVFQFVHPIGILLLGGAALALAARIVFERMYGLHSIRTGETPVIRYANFPLPLNRPLLIRASVVAGLALLAILKVYVTSKIPEYRDTYAEREASWQTAWARWHDGVSGWPIRGLCYMWAAGAMIVLRPLLGRRIVPRESPEFQSAFAAIGRALGGSEYASALADSRQTGTSAPPIVSPARYPLPRGAGSRLLRARVLSLILAGVIIILSFPTLRFDGHIGDLWLPYGAAAMLVVYMFLAEGEARIAALAASALLGFIAIRSALRVAVFHDPPATLLLIVAAGGGAWAFHRALRTAAGREMLLNRLPMLCVFFGAAAWVYWAGDGRLWWKALDYRRWIFPLTLPFFAFATVEACLPKPMGADEASIARANFRGDRRVRGPVALLLGGTFALVLGLQCTVWRAEGNRLMADVAAYPSAIMPDWKVPWIVHTPMDHWGAQDYVIAMQGKRPRKLMLDRREVELMSKRPPEPPHEDLYVKRDAAARAADWFDLSGVVEQSLREGELDARDQRDREGMRDVPP